MVKKFYIFILLLIGAINGLQAQTRLTYQANELYRQHNSIEAKALIDQAVTETEDSLNYQAWMIRAAIYKSLFNSDKDRSLNSPERITALNSVLKSMDLNTEKLDFKQSINLLIQISNTYYNDGIYATNNLDLNDLHAAENYYLEYKRIRKIAYPDKSMDEMDIKFYLALATSYAKVFQPSSLDSTKTSALPLDSELSKTLFYLTIKSLKNVLQIDSNNYGANFNLAIYYYNQGALRALSIDAGTEIEDLFLIKAYGLEMFAKALPFMLKAHQLRNREETYEGLMGIYRALNEDEKYLDIQSEYNQFLEEHPELKKDTIPHGFQENPDGDNKK